MTEEVEHCWFIYGIRIKNQFIGFSRFSGTGSHASVKFNWKKGMNPFVLGWIHTHPSEYGTMPSETDNKTMRSWVKGLGRPMVCAIACGDKITWYDYHRAQDRSISKSFMVVDKILLLIQGSRVENTEFSAED